MIVKICPHCNITYKFRREPTRDFLCPTCKKFKVQSTQQVNDTRSTQHCHWLKLHNYAPGNASTWDVLTAKKWYAEWFATIPNISCNCREEFRQLEEQNPIDFSTPEKFFEGSWYLHNLVNKKLGKHQLRLDEAYSIYWPPQNQNFKYPFVTALSLLPNHREVQQTTLASWKRFGAYIVASNTAEEIKELKSLYPEVDEWVTNNEVGTYCYPTQLINNLANVAILLSSPIVLLNSDIEVHGKDSGLYEYCQDIETTQVLGSRWDYEYSRHNAIQFEWGIDLVTFTPEQARRLPNLFVAIGHAMWDYIIPWITLENGYNIRLLNERLLYHKKHTQNWNQKSWERGAVWLANRSGWSVDYQEGSVKYRKAWSTATYRQGQYSYLPRNNSTNMQELIERVKKSGLPPYPKNRGNICNVVAT